MSRLSRRLLDGLLIGCVVISSTMFIARIPTNEPNRTESVFAYGTLLHPTIRMFACRCRTVAEPATLDGFVRDGRNILPTENGSVNGFLLRVTPNELRNLDRYERVPEKYVRIRVEVNEATHWAYVLTGTPAAPPASI